MNPDAWNIAKKETSLLESRRTGSAGMADSALRPVRKEFEEKIPIGGPPCQACSLAGRARKGAEQGYVPERDQRHYLFREYIRVLDVLRPAAFVMENVKGMLSSKLASGPVFEMLMDDLSSIGPARSQLCELFAIRVDLERASLHRPKRYAEFVLRTEEFGIPQRRHRVIIIGIRSEFASRVANAAIHVPGHRATVKQVIGRMPKLRSGTGSNQDGPDYWREQVMEAAKLLADIHAGKQDQDL